MNCTRYLAGKSITVAVGDDHSAWGEALDAAGDVNTDGYDDIIVGAFHTDSYAGAAYVYHGSTDGLETTPNTTLVGYPKEHLGEGVAGGRIGSGRSVGVGSTIGA